MASQLSSGQRPARHRGRRWAIAVAAVMALLVAYIGAVAWFSARLGDDIQAGMQQTPVVEDVRHRAD